MTFPTQWENNPNVPNHRPDMHSQLNGKIKFMFQTTNHCHMNVVFIGNNNPSNPSRSPIYVRKYPCSSLFGIFWDCYYNNIILYHSHNLPMIAEQHFFWWWLTENKLQVVLPRFRWSWKTQLFLWQVFCGWKELEIQHRGVALPSGKLT